MQQHDRDKGVFGFAFQGQPAFPFYLTGQFSRFTKIDGESVYHNLTIQKVFSAGKHLCP
jgi:hypothetical protein